MILKYNITNNYKLETETKCFLYIMFLKESNVINDAKFSGMMSSLRKGELCTYRKTYHCKINNKWYSHTHMVEILLDVCSDMNTVSELKFESVIQYVNKLLSKNRNYCIDYIFDNMIKPVLSQCHYDTDNYDVIFNNFGVKVGNLTTIDNINTHGYCCDDCSGDFEEYKKMQFEYYFKKSNLDSIGQEFTKLLNNYKEEDHLNVGYNKEYTI